MTLKEALEKIKFLEEQIETLKEQSAQLQKMLRPQLTGYERLPMSPSDSAILGLLVNTGEATNERIEQLLWGNRTDGGPDNARNSIKVAICKLRRKLVPLGVTVRTNYGFGYSMSRSDRDKMTGDLDEFFEVVRDHRFKKLKRAPAIQRPKPAIPMSDRPKGKWAW